MKLKFYSDSAKPCWRCSGTIAAYQTDTEVSLIDVKCISCGAPDVFSTSTQPSTAADVSAAHRKEPSL